MVKKAKPPTGYKRTKHEGGYSYIKQVTGGGSVQWSTDSHWSAYDAKGRYLGFSAKESHATMMAETGRVNVFGDTVCELELWEFWNEASQRTAVLLCEETKEQVVSLEDGTLLVAKEESDGYKVRLAEQDEFFNDTDDCFDLKYIDKCDVLKCRGLVAAAADVWRRNSYDSKTGLYGITQEQMDALRLALAARGA